MTTMTTMTVVVVIAAVHFRAQLDEHQIETTFSKNGPTPATFSVYFRLFNMFKFRFKLRLKKVYIVCLGFEAGQQDGRHR